jgi:hypothetical protein
VVIRASGSTETEVAAMNRSARVPAAQ